MAKAIQTGQAERGILMCGTGMGVCLVANKFKGIYAAVAESATTARLHWVINRANVLCMGAWVVGPYVARDMVDAWLERHDRRGLQRGTAAGAGRRLRAHPGNRGGELQVTSGNLKSRGVQSNGSCCNRRWSWACSAAGMGAALIGSVKVPLARRLRSTNPASEGWSPPSASR